jgi:hypothetical protein
VAYRLGGGRSIRLSYEGGEWRMHRESRRSATTVVLASSASTDDGTLCIGVEGMTGGCYVAVSSASAAWSLANALTACFTVGKKWFGLMVRVSS